MELPLICSAFDIPDVNTRLKSIQELTQFPMSEELLITVIVPSLHKYLDDCEEVLLLTITQILNLSFSFQSHSAALALLEPLETLASIIDENVRQSAVQAIIKLFSFYCLTENHSLKLLSRLINSNASGAVSGLEFISCIFPCLSLKKQRKAVSVLLQLFRHGGCGIKAKIAEFLKSLAGTEDLYSEVYVCMEELVKDPEDLVRICGVDLGIQLKVDIFAIEPVVHDESWKVRYYIGQQISRLTEYTDQRALCEMVKDYLNDTEIEVRNVTFVNLSELFKHTIDEVFTNEIMSHIQNIATALPFMSFQVISSVIQLCKVVGKTNTETYLQSALKELFKSKNTNIEMLLMQEIKTILPLVSEEFLQVYAFPVFFALLEHKLWKIRAQALEFLPGLEFLNVLVFNQHFNQFLITGLNDLVHAVRLAAIKTVSNLFGIYGEEWFRDCFLQVVYEKSISECYINRITAVNLLNELGEKIDFERFGEFFFEIFQRLCEDKVVNVRICVARLGGRIQSSRVLERFREGFEEGVRKLQMDCDVDVRMLICRE